MDAADDGTIIGFDFNLLDRAAWIRPPGGSIIALDAYLQANGAGGVPGLWIPEAISADGGAIVGNNFGRAWIATLAPAECPADLDGSGTVDFADILAVLAAWGPCP